MTAVVPYALFLGLVAALVFAIGAHRVSWWKVSAHALLVVVLLGAALDTQGRPKPMWAELRDRAEIEVVAAVYHPGEAIYVLIRDAGPMLYALPWDVRLAREMQEAVAGTGGALLRRGEGDEENDGGEGGPWQAHPLPVLGNPPKVGP